MSTVFCVLLILVILPYAFSFSIRKAKSCLELKEDNKLENNGYYSLYDDADNVYSTYCDFQSEPGFVWTLIESLSLTSGQTKKFRKGFFANVPSDECSPNWLTFRLSVAKMTAIYKSEGATHFRVTCNFDPNDRKGLQDHLDYMRISFCAYKSFFVPKKACECTVADYINISGYKCKKCSIPICNSAVWHLHVDMTEAGKKCDKFVVPVAKVGEDTFGHYGTHRSQFKCASAPNATTNWWLGGSII